MFYDLHVNSRLSIGENSVEEMAAMAKRLGLNGIGIVQHYPNISEIDAIDDIDIVKCIMIKPNNTGELGEIAGKVRNKCEIIMVHGGSYDINRAACENSLVDVLCHPELGRKDSGLDHICIKAAHDNDVAMEINFHEILESSRKGRVYILSAMKKNTELCRRYETPVVTTSGAVTRWDLRSGRELSAITNILGLDLGSAIDSTSFIPDNMVKQNREKLSGKRWQGLSVVEE